MKLRKIIMTIWMCVIPEYYVSEKCFKYIINGSHHRQILFVEKNLILANGILWKNKIPLKCSTVLIKLNMIAIQKKKEKKSENFHRLKIFKQNLAGPRSLSLIILFCAGAVARVS